MIIFLLPLLSYFILLYVRMTTFMIHYALETLLKFELINLIILASLNIEDETTHIMDVLLMFPFMHSARFSAFK